MLEHPTIRILVADDHLLVRDGLKRLIDDQPGMEVVAEAMNGADALQLAQELMPAIAIVDVSMPGMDGVALTHLLHQCCPAVRVLALTRHDDAAFVRKMMQAGASGYVLKQSPSAELIRAIHSVFDGIAYVDPSVRTAERARDPWTDQADEASAHEPLLPLEEQVLRLLAASYSNEEIAACLSLDLKAIARARVGAMRKVGVTTRFAVIRYAQARGWLPG
jgi:DNA-binding NarL/FixJ family response regulator